MVAQFLPVPRFAAYDADGAPLSGGLLHSFVSGTSTRKALFADAALTTALENPLELNAAGQATAYLDGAYKLRLENALGVLQWELDPIGESVAALPSGLTFASRQVTVEAESGETLLTAPQLYRAGEIVLGTVGAITTTFGAGSGLLAIDVGDTLLSDRWARALPRLGGTELTPLDYSSYAPFLVANDTDGLLSATAGTFDATGSITLTVFYLTLAVPGVAPDETPDESEPVVTHGTTQVDVTSSPGTTTIAVPNLYPSGVVVDGVIAEITTGFGNTTGLTTLQLGDTDLSNRWGSGIPRTAGTVTHAGYWPAFAPFTSPDAGSGTLIAEAGTFDGTGAATVTCFWTRYTLS